jgi:branched-subunit amino acid transport protein AzlD
MLPNHSGIELALDAVLLLREHSFVLVPFLIYVKHSNILIKLMETILSVSVISIICQYSYNNVMVYQIQLYHSS